MSFLDSMVSNLIRDSTGLPVGRLARRIGGGNLLLVGGAALAGALLASQGTKSPGGWGVPGGPQPRTLPPPPPGDPAAGAAGEAPLPPLPTLPHLETPPSEAAAAAEPTGSAKGAGGEVPELPPALLFAVVRTMVAAALADGTLAPEERATIERHLDGSGLTEEQVARVRKDLVLPASAEELAAMVDGAEPRETLYRSAALVVRADREVSELERGFLEHLGGALGIAAERRAALTAEVFADPPAPPPGA